MMSSPKPSDVLSDIIQNYLLERDLLVIARRAIQSGDVAALTGTSFVGRPVADAMSDVDRLETRLDEMTVVALWTTFERFIGDRARAALATLSSVTPAPFGQRLEQHFSAKIEYERFDEILDLFNGLVNSNEIGSAKAIKRYRDWIAHRNPKKKTVATSPAIAAPILGNIMDQLP